MTKDSSPVTTSRAGQIAERLTAYAEALRAAGAIRTRPVQAAFAAVPRHRFLPHFRYRAGDYTLDPTSEPPGEVLDIVYANNALLVADDENIVVVDG